MFGCVSSMNKKKGEIYWEGAFLAKRKSKKVKKKKICPCYRLLQLLFQLEIYVIMAANGVLIDVIGAHYFCANCRKIHSEVYKFNRDGPTSRVDGVYAEKDQLYLVPVPNLEQFNVYRNVVYATYMESIRNDNGTSARDKFLATLMAMANNAMRE